VIKKKIMQAAVLSKFNDNLNLFEVKIPKLKYGQVLVQIRYSGICRSQLMEIEGGRDNRKWLPHLLGHEASGIIEEIGPGVKKVKKGDQVILTWIKSKGIDAKTANFNYKNKKINSGKVTTFSNYSIVSESRVVKKPKSISLKDSVLLGCSLSTGMGMVLNESEISSKNKVVLIGLGGIGLGVLIALKHKKIKNIIVIDNDMKKLSIAKKLGIKNFFYNLNKETIKKIFKEFKNGADICYECAGSVKTIEYGLDVISEKGRIHFASHPNKKDKISINPHDLIKGKIITGSWGGSVRPDIDFIRFSKILNGINSNLDFISSKIYKLKNINDAIDDFKRKKIFRPIVKMQH